MPHLSNPQSKALAAFSVEIAKEEGCGPQRRRQETAVCGKSAAVERGMQRFIASDRIDRAEFWRALARWAIGSLPEDKPVVILVDVTGLNDRLKAMVAAVAFEGRAIPVAWRRCPNEDWQMGLADLITETLGWVQEVGPDRALGGAFV